MAKEVLLLNADSVIPNIALGKISTYYKNKGYKINYRSLNIPYYPNKKKRHIFIDTKNYYRVFCSVIFDGSINYIYGEGIVYGGTGSDNLQKQLPDKIENLDIDYSLFPDNDFSYGFISRGCVRKCYFCKVWRKEGQLKQVSNIDKIIKHKKVRFLDNNFLALSNHKEMNQHLKNC